LQLVVDILWISRPGICVACDKLSHPAPGNSCRGSLRSPPGNYGDGPIPPFAV